MPAIHKSSAKALFVFFAAVCAVSAALAAHASSGPHIFQRPAISNDMIAFGYADDLWVVPRAGGRATRLTTGVGIETAPIFSPDGCFPKPVPPPEPTPSSPPRSSSSP